MALKKPAAAVLKAVDELNYRPNVIAQSLLSQSTGCIGVICAQENINQTTGYLYALENTSASIKTSAAAFRTHENRSDERP